ncbi:MAG: hypothetical protein QXN34_05945 [Archaeoglobaceae archaeon]
MNVEVLAEGSGVLLGKYRIGEIIEIEAEFDEELFNDLLPALFSEIAIAKITLRDCFLTQKREKFQE